MCSLTCGWVVGMVFVGNMQLQQERQVADDQLRYTHDQLRGAENEISHLSEQLKFAERLSMCY